MALSICAMQGGFVDAETGVPMVEALDVLDEGGEEREPLGTIPMLQALGVSALPAEPTGNEYCEGLVAHGVPGVATAVVVGGRDARSGDVIAQLKGGETCVHSTGPGFESRVFCKDQLVAVVVGKDYAISVDRKNQKISVAAPWVSWELNAKNGTITSATKKGAIIQTEDTCWIKYGKIMFGESPTSPVAHGATPANLLSPSILVSPT